MGMQVDQAGHDQEACRVDDVACGIGWNVLLHGSDLAGRKTDVRAQVDTAAGIEDAAVLHHEIEQSLPPIVNHGRPSTGIFTVPNHTQ